MWFNKEKYFSKEEINFAKSHGFTLGSFEAGSFGASETYLKKVIFSSTSKMVEVDYISINLFKSGISSYEVRIQDNHGGTYSGNGHSTLIKAIELGHTEARKLFTCAIDLLKMEENKNGLY